MPARSPFPHRPRLDAGPPGRTVVSALVVGLVVAACGAGDAGAAQFVLAPASGPAGSTATVRGSGLPRDATVKLRVGRRRSSVRTSARGLSRKAVRIPATAHLPVPVVARLGGRRFRMKFEIDGPSTLVTSEMATSEGVRLRYTSDGLTPGTRLELSATGLPPGAAATVETGRRVVAQLRIARSGVVEASVPADRLRVGRNQLVLRVGPQLIRLAAKVGGDPRIAAAGDIACGDNTPARDPCADAVTADIVRGLGPTAVLALGDLQYERGVLSDFREHYGRSWGRFKAITYPAVGNHEYGDRSCGGACGYFDYFNGRGQRDGRAGKRREGYYAFDVGAWRLYALNSNCDVSKGPRCTVGSRQERWLRADLARHPRRCALAFMHHPLFSSETRPDADTVAVAPLWQAFYDAGGDVMLVGHSHHYERFAPQDPQGRPDAARGIREFIVGTGGRNMYGFSGVEPNSEVRSFEAFGVLALNLHPTSYDWRFVAQPDRSFTDAGTQPCH